MLNMGMKYLGTAVDSAYTWAFLFFTWILPALVAMVIVPPLLNKYVAKEDRTSTLGIILTFISGIAFFSLGCAGVFLGLGIAIVLVIEGGTLLLLSLWSLTQKAL
jgi:hypothetical protein